MPKPDRTGSMKLAYRAQLFDAMETNGHRLTSVVCKTSTPGSNPGGASNFA